MRWRVIPLSTHSAAENMAIDEMLLTLGQEPTIRFYQFVRPSITLGYQQSTDILYKGHVAPEDIAMRVSGGNAVYHGVHDLTYSVVAPIEIFKKTAHPLHDTFDAVRGWIVSALNSLDGVDVMPYGKNDIVTTRHKKIAGNAIKRNTKNGYVLVHGSIFVRSTPEQWAVSFKVPLNQFQSKLARVKDYCNRPDLVEQVYRQLYAQFCDNDLVHETYERKFTQPEHDKVKELLAAHYQNNQWLHEGQKSGTACAVDIVDDSLAPDILP